MPRAKRKTSDDPLSHALVALRTKMEWDQTDAAAQIPVSRSTWIRWESVGNFDSVARYALKALLKIHAPEILKKLPK